MITTMWPLPDEPLRRRVIRSAILGCAGVVVVATWLGWWLDFAPVQPLIAAALFATIMTIAVLAIGRGHPFPSFGVANHVTMTRAMCTALAGSALVGPPVASLAWMGVAITVVVAALDGLDGWMARRSRMASAFGARFDMETDALFILVLSALVWQHGKAGIWVLGSGLMRYAFVAAGWWQPWLAAPLRPTRRGKTVAVLQFAGLGVALTPAVPMPWSAAIAAAALAALTWSFAVDILYLARHHASPAVSSSR